jgi:RNAse (barnase) inhibitor barstar
MDKVKTTPSTYYKANNERLVFVDGNTCDTIEKCYATLEQQLSLPDYFGFNLDALEEVLADADWIKEDKIHIIILNEVDLLKNDLPRKNAFLEIITQNDNKKIDVTILGKNT